MRYVAPLFLMLVSCQSEPLRDAGSGDLPNNDAAKQVIVFAVDLSPSLPAGQSIGNAIIGAGAEVGGRPEGQLVWWVHLCSDGRDVKIQSLSHTPTLVSVPSKSSLVAEGADEREVDTDTSLVRCVQQNFAGNFTAGLAPTDDGFGRIDREPFAEFYEK